MGLGVLLAGSCHYFCQKMANSVYIYGVHYLDLNTVLLLIGPVKIASLVTFQNRNRVDTSQAKQGVRANAVSRASIRCGLATYIVAWGEFQSRARVTLAILWRGHGFGIPQSSVVGLLNMFYIPRLSAQHLIGLRHAYSRDPFDEPHGLG